MIESSTGGVDTARSSISLTLASFVENLTLSGSAAINGTGNTLNNILTGNSAANLLSASAGNDTITGGGGADTLDGGLGNDNMSGGTGSDTYILDSALDLVTEAADQGVDTVQSSASFTLGANIENLVLTGSSATTGTGNTLANVLTGANSANRLLGLEGADSLAGGGGNDTLTGGDGADHFVFTASVSGTDTITDFNALDGGLAAGDLLEFVGLVRGTFAYIGAAAFSAGSDDTEARVFGSQVQVDLDGNGVSDININLTGLTDAAQLTALDFLFS